MSGSSASHCCWYFLPDTVGWHQQILATGTGCGGQGSMSALSPTSASASRGQHQAVQLQLWAQIAGTNKTTRLAGQGHLERMSFQLNDGPGWKGFSQLVIANAFPRLCVCVFVCVHMCVAAVTQVCLLLQSTSQKVAVICTLVVIESDIFLSLGDTTLWMCKETAIQNRSCYWRLVAVITWSARWNTSLVDCSHFYILH